MDRKNWSTTRSFNGMMRVVGDLNAFRTNFGAAFGDVAITDSLRCSQFLDPVLGVERMHFQRGDVNQKSRADEFVVLAMVAQNMTNILAKKTLDAFSKFLDAIDVGLLAFATFRPAQSGGRGLKGLILFFTRKFHDTSVIKSLMIGNAFIGSTRTGFSSGKSLSRVMHISFGIPFTSAEHEPHLPALQFQRQARSFACVRWMSCTASSTTIPSATSAV